MNISRLLDQPYLDLTGVKKPWIADDYYTHAGYHSHIIPTLDFLFNPAETSVSAFLSKGQWINSNETFLSICQPIMEQIESLMIHKLFLTKPSFNEDFRSLSLQEKLDLVEIPDYLLDRNLRTLWDYIFASE